MKMLRKIFYVFTRFLIIIIAVFGLAFEFLTEIPFILAFYVRDLSNLKLARGIRRKNEIESRR